MTDNLAKARAARSANAQAEIWKTVSRSKQVHGCTCDLKPGQSREDLRTLGHGCTNGRYICPTLDTYRRLLPATPLSEEEQELLEGTV